MPVDQFDRTCDAIVELLIPYFIERMRQDQENRRKYGKPVAIPFSEISPDTDIEALHRRPYLFALEMAFRMFGQYLNSRGGIKLMRQVQTDVVSRFRTSNVPFEMVLGFFSKKWDGIGDWRA